MTFKCVKQILGLASVAVLSYAKSFAAPQRAEALPPKDAILIYVGTFTDMPAQSKGIYLFWFRRADAQMTLTPLGVAAETPSPTFMTLDPKRHLLFTVNETDSFQGKPGGAVSSFSIEPNTGKLTLISQRPSMGTRPCHIVLDKTGKNVVVANYNSGSVAVLPVDNHGKLGEPTCVIQDTGSSINPARQTGPHAHCVTLSPDNRFAFVCDLGIDKVLIYKFDAEHGKLLPNDPASVSATPGSGPRHLTFSPNGKFAYLICEMASTVSAFAYDQKTGALKMLQTVSSLPSSFQGVNTAAEIAIEPTGKFLFASNRGENSVAQFQIDKKLGTLEWMGEQSTGGKTPRHFAIAPSGRDLVICNQDSNSVMRSGMDSSGRLLPATLLANVPAPVCTVFVPAGSGAK